MMYRVWPPDAVDDSDIFLLLLPVLVRCLQQIRRTRGLAC